MVAIYSLTKRNLFEKEPPVKKQKQIKPSLS